MSKNEFSALLETLGEDIYWFFVWFLGNLPFILPVLIGLYFIQKKYSKVRKKEEIEEK